MPCRGREEAQYIVLAYRREVMEREFAMRLASKIEGTAVRKRREVNEGSKRY
jgi:hypothetical protein